jgi:PKD repeat protein
MGNMPPLASISANPINGSQPLTVNFTGTGTDTDGTVTSYSWDFGDATTSNEQNPNHTYNNSGQYTVTLTVVDNAGGLGRATISVTVTQSGEGNDSPIAYLSASPLSGIAPLTINFMGSGTDNDGTIVSYSWNFGNGSTSNEQNPSHTYNAAGTYTATLTVTDDGGATGSTSLAIAVVSEGMPPAAPTGLHITGFN